MRAQGIVQLLARSVALVLVGGSLGAFAGGAFGLFFALFSWAFGGGLTRGPGIVGWAVAAGAITGVLLGVCRGLDRAFDSSEEASPASEQGCEAPAKRWLWGRVSLASPAELRRRALLPPLNPLESRRDRP